MSEGNNIRHVCRDWVISGTENDTAACTGKFALIAQHKGIIRIFHRIFRTDNGYMINIFADIQIPVNHIVLTFMPVRTDELISHTHQFGKLGIIGNICPADGKNRAAAVFHQITQGINHIIRIACIYCFLQRIRQRSGIKPVHRTVGIGDFVSCAKDQGCIGIFRLIRYTNNAVRHTVKVHTALCPDNIECAVNGRGCSLEAARKAVNSISVHTGESACHSRSRTVCRRARAGCQRHAAFRAVVFIVACTVISCIVHAVIMRLSCFHAGGLYRFELCHIDRIGIFTAGCHTCNLSGIAFRLVPHRSSTDSRSPGGRRIGRSRLGRGGISAHPRCRIRLGKGSNGHTIFYRRTA